MKPLLFLACAGFAIAQPQYDLLIKSGHVIDPKNGISAVRDVAIKDKKIAEVAPNIPASKALKVINATGLYVTPGLVDIHVHVYAGTGQRGAYSGDNSVYPDGFTFRSGVTTVADAGSSGWRNFPDFKDRVIDRSRTRVLAFLNIVGKGMGGGSIEQDVGDMDAKATADQALRYPGVVIGIKTAHFAGPEWTPVERAVQAGTSSNVPVMVDFGVFRPERPYQDLVLKKLRPGDISTHMYLVSVPMLDASDKLLPYLPEARRRGVIFDAGHGAGSFLFQQGHIFLFFYDPECSHCDAAARRMAKLNWKETELIGIPTRVPQFAADFLKDTKLHAKTSLDVQPLRDVFKFIDPPYGVALDNGHQKAAIINFEESEPAKTLRQIGYVE